MPIENTHRSSMIVSSKYTVSLGIQRTEAIFSTRAWRGNTRTLTRNATMIDVIRMTMSSVCLS